MSKGSRREREFVELLKKAGMATYRPATVRFGENDMFGLFDVLALSPNHTEVYAIQVKSNRAVGIRKWNRNTTLFRRLGFRTFYAVPVDNKGWRLIECHGNVSVLNGSPVYHAESGRKANVVDEREHVCDMGSQVTNYFIEEGTRE